MQILLQSPANFALKIIREYRIELIGLQNQFTHFGNKSACKKVRCEARGRAIFNILRIAKRRNRRYSSEPVGLIPAVSNSTLTRRTA
jgi:hypothetical protein